jgi:predicted RNase H-like nuclease (RuvC/YqgF family)
MSDTELTGQYKKFYIKNTEKQLKRYKTLYKNCMAENKKLKDQLEEMRYHVPHIDKTVMDGKKEIEKLRTHLESIKKHMEVVLGNEESSFKLSAVWLLANRALNTSEVR